MTDHKNIIYVERFKGKRKPVERVENEKPDIRKKTRLRIKMETMERIYLENDIFRARVLPFRKRKQIKR